MTKKEWEKVIKDACTEAGTYKTEFDSVIGTLAGIMEVRDTAQEQYEQSGGKPVVAYTNKGGYTNLRKNPALQVITEQNATALSYWKELGLTPSGYKKLEGDLAGTGDTAFEEMLSGIGV